jgi:glycosylphosphatidylinositol transamidase
MLSRCRLQYTRDASLIISEGLNGRLPNQDLLNTATHVARYAGGVSPRIHNIDNDPHWVWTPPATLLNIWMRMQDLIPGVKPFDRHSGQWEWVYPRWLKDYILGVRGLWDHFGYAALGGTSGGHGVLAR